MAQRRESWRRWPRYERNVQGAWSAIDDLRDAVDEIVEADRIAEAVTAKMREQQKDVFTKGTFILNERQTWSAIGAVLVAALALVLDSLAHAGVF